MSSTTFASGRSALDIARVVDDDKHYALFVLAGDLDEVSAPQLLELLVNAARLPAIDLVIVDLLRVGYLGAPGANCFDAARRAAGRNGAQLVLCRPSRFLHRALEVTGLACLVEETLEPSLDDGGPAPPEPDRRWT